jgi:hypothetical protein
VYKFVRISTTYVIEDTKDGGAFAWIVDIKSERCTHWLREPHESSQVTIDWRGLAKSPPKTSLEEKLSAHCHCNGVKFYISHPSDQSLQTQSPFPDMLIPFTSEAPSANTSKVPWCISKDGNRFYLAIVLVIVAVELLAICFFNSGLSFRSATSLVLTRSHSGNLLESWKTFESSKGVEQSFCAVCGANMFWNCDFRPSVRC